MLSSNQIKELRLWIRLVELAESGVEGVGVTNIDEIHWYNGNVSFGLNSLYLRVCINPVSGYDDIRSFKETRSLLREAIKDMEAAA